MGRDVRYEENTFVTILWGKEIKAQIKMLDMGCFVLLTGGERTHIGAVSWCNNSGRMQSLSKEGHKETRLTEVWTKWLYRVTKTEVTVAAGIHYDHLRKEEVEEVLSVTDNLLQHVVEYMKSSDSFKIKVGREQTYFVR